MQPIEAIDRRRADAVGYQSASHAIRDLLERALAGDTLSACDGYRLAQAEGVDALAVRAAAGALRDRHKGRRVTYSRKVFLPVTNLCVDRCSYCTFRKDPEEPGAWTMRPDEIARSVERGSRLGCKEALMCLGDKPERAFPGYRRQLRAWGYEDTVDYLRQACAIALAGGLLPHTNAGLLSRDEMRLLRPVNVSMGLML